MRCEREAMSLTGVEAMRWPRTGTLARGGEDDVVLALHGFNCKNEHGKGMSDAPDGI